MKSGWRTVNGQVARVTFTEHSCIHGSVFAVKTRHNVGKMPLVSYPQAGIYLDKVESNGMRYITIKNVRMPIHYACILIPGIENYDR